MAGGDSVCCEDTALSCLFRSFSPGCIFPGMEKKREQNTCQAPGEGVYIFLFEKGPVRKKSGCPGMVISRYPLARFVKGVMSCQKNVRFVEKVRTPATM
jgi:hypothetical protein